MENKIRAMHSPLISVISPAFNEVDNLYPFYDQLVTVFEQLEVNWEWIIVDDHSADDTFAIASILAKKDNRVRAYRFSRNYGSHMALRCGLENAKGDCVVGMAADLQDPPALIPTMLDQWKGGTQVVWAARENRAGQSRSTLFFSRLYYRIMRNIVGLKDMPSEGADFFLLDHKVVQAINNFSERNVSLFALISWMGFRQEVIMYDKQARLHGKSGWGFKKKLKMAVDSLTSFSYKPIRAMTITGFIISLLAFGYLVVVLINFLFGVALQGWTSLMVVILLVGGLQIMMIGILGEYIWRSLDESRRRPRYIIEAATDQEDPL